MSSKGHIAEVPICGGGPNDLLKYCLSWMSCHRHNRCHIVNKNRHLSNIYNRQKDLENIWSYWPPDIVYVPMHSMENNWQMTVIGGYLRSLSAFRETSVKQCTPVVVLIMHVKCYASSFNVNVFDLIEKSCPELPHRTQSQLLWCHYSNKLLV